MGKLMLLVEESAYRPSSWVIPLSSFFAASLFIDDDVFCFLEEEAWCAADSARGVTMAVALATLPLKRVLAGAGDTCFAAATGAALAGALATGLTALAAGLAATLGAGLATGLAAGFATAVFLAITLAGFATDFAAALRVLTAIGLPLLAAGLVATDFFGATFFATTLLAGAFFTGTFFTAAFLATTFFAAGALAALDFFAGDLTTGFLGSDLGAAFFAVGLAAALGFAMVFGAALTDVLPALFTAAPLPALLPDEALPFCALAAVELRVVFAISLHRLWPWRPGVIAHVSCTSKLASEILVPLPDASRCSPVNIPTRFILWLLRLYKRWLSPLLGPRCRFHPSCSDYARIAVTRFGPWRGSLLTGWRLLRCQPLCEGGEDPVPEHFRYPRCRCKSNSHDLR